MGNGRVRFRALLASTSLTALLVGGGAPAAWACYTGPFVGGHTNSGATGCIVVNNTSFSGTLGNTGTISPGGPTGIAVVNGSTISGQISDLGIIAASGFGILIDGTSKINSVGFAIKITGPTFIGGISNAGTIAAGSNGILVGGTAVGGGSTVTISSFSGGISNAGTISTGALMGIAVGGTAAAHGAITISNFSGGISNAGTISAHVNGILVGGKASGSLASVAISTFSGGISNSGLISAHGGVGIAVGGVAGSGGSLTVGTFSNGIINSGTITAKQNGIFIGGVAAGSSRIAISAFSGGIANSGKITGATRSGIVVGGTAQASSTVTISSFGGGISNAGMIVAPAHDGIFVGGNASNATVTISTFASGITNSGTISGHAGIAVGGSASNGGAVTISSFGDGIANIGKIMAIGAGGAGILVAGTSLGGGSVTISTFSGGISNAGTIQAAGTGGVGIDVAQVQTFSSGITNSGLITVGGAGIIVGATNFSGNISNSGAISAKTGILINSGMTFAAGGAVINSGTIIGTTAAIDASAATSSVTIDQAAGLISGAIKLSARADQLNISGGTIAGNIVGQGSSDAINFNAGAGTFTYGAAFSFTGINQVNVNSGLIVLDGSNSATTLAVNGGTLEVDGTIAVTSSVTVNSGGTLSGTGTVDPVTTIIMSGGALAPGNASNPTGTLAVTGNLAFQSGALYVVQIAPAAAASVAVAGAATLSGATVNAVFAAGNYAWKQYTILTATGGLGGTTFAALTNTNLPAGSSDNLSYSANDQAVYLNLVPGFTAFTGLNLNQQNVATALTGYFNATGGIPAVFLVSPDGLTQLDGELATGAERAAFQLTTEFLNLMLDPFISGRGNGPGAGGGGAGATGFAPDEEASLPPDVALAYAGILKAPPKTNFDQRWSAWGTAYGGANTAQGNAAVGSNTINAGTYGVATGMDYRVSPTTVVGFALAGAGTNWGLANALGSGRSDALQVGGYGITWFGRTYLSGSLAFTNNWFTTNRSALGDQLTANFSGQNYGARLEAGYRFTPSLPSPASGGGLGWGLGVTPYAALQAQDFQSPSYSESDVTGGGFGLSYAAMNATDVRTELGSRFDDPTLLCGKPLILFGRLAWAHDFVSNPSLSAAFEALPGSSFTVNGAPIPHDLALTTAGLQYFLAANWQVTAKFEGDLASASQTYGGSGTLRYSW